MYCICLNNVKTYEMFEALVQLLQSSFQSKHFFDLAEIQHQI